MKLFRLKSSSLSPQIGKHNHFMLRDFFASTMTDSRIALVGVGVDTMHLTRMADLLHLTKEKGPADAKVRYGTKVSKVKLCGK